MGPGWLLRWLDQDDPNRTLAIRVIRSILRQPERWSEGPYGLTNLKDGLGVWTAEGYRSVALAVDGDKQLYPRPYWRWMLNRVVREHRKQTLANMSVNTAARLTSPV